MTSSDVQNEITESFEEFEISFRRHHPLLWWSALLGPFVVTGVVLLAIALIQSPAFAGEIVGMAFATFFLFGRFIILVDESFGLSTTMTSSNLFIMVTYMDMMTAVFVAFNIGILFGLPRVGPRIAGLVADAQFILRMQPWMRRATFMGLVVFVIFPTSTTGSIGGSIFGRLLGMNRLQTLLAIFVGSVSGNALMLFFSKQLRPLKQLLQDSTEAKVISIVILIVVVVAIERWYSAMKNRYLAKSESESSDESDD